MINKKEAGDKIKIHLAFLVYRILSPINSDSKRNIGGNESVKLI